MSGLHEVDCSGCGRRHVTSGEQARQLRVLRCECGHFVRLDRALAERRSEPSPPPPIEIVNAHTNDEDLDDATQMLSSLAAVAATNGGRGRTRSAQPSLVDDERSSRPVPRDGSLRPSSPAPARQRQASIAPTDKPLWYVDLGGTELVEMTIEQLILARRSGKLGEGALVWREGMPSWRPVGTLIPAASASSHPSPLSAPSAAPMPSRPSAPAAARTPVPDRPPPPKRTPPPSPRAEDPTPQSLASYERPLATLEFALERPVTQPLLTPMRASMASIDASAQQLSRPPTPLPRASSSPFTTPFPRPGHLPRLSSLATPMPSASPRLSPPPPPPVAPASVAPAFAAPAPVAPAPVFVAPASPIPPSAVTRTSDRPNQLALANLQGVDSASERPRWVSVGIASIVCVTASAAGASLVRSLKQQKKPQLPVSAVSAAAVSASAAKQASEPPRSAPSSAPLVVSLESLSVEHKHTLPRPVRATPRPVPVASAESGDETPTTAAESVPEAPAQEAPNSSELPAAARSNPYGSGSLIDQIEKATADEEAGQ